LENELGGIKFVISRDKLLANLEADDRKGNGSRRVGLSRRKSLLEKHKSIEQIRSYPEGVCIEVGTAWARDILNHQLREDADAVRKEKNDDSSINSEGSKNKEAREPRVALGKKRNIAEMSFHEASHPIEDDFGRMLDVDIPQTESLDALANILFTSNKNREIMEGNDVKRRTTEPKPEFIWGKELFDVEDADVAMYITSCSSIETAEHSWESLFDNVDFSTPRASS